MWLEPNEYFKKGSRFRFFFWKRITFIPWMYHLSPFKVRKRVGAVQWKDGRKAKGRKGHACEKASWTANNHDNKFLHACVRELERKCETKSLVEAPHKSEGRPSLLLFQIILHVTTIKSTVSPEANVTSSPNIMLWARPSITWQTQTIPGSWKETSTLAFIATLSQHKWLKCPSYSISRFDATADHHIFPLLHNWPWKRMCLLPQKYPCSYSTEPLSLPSHLWYTWNWFQKR